MLLRFFTAITFLVVSSLCAGSIEITPETALIDQDTSIIVKDLNPNETILIEAESIDDNNTRWISHASFQANDAGVVDLSMQAPVEGTYSEVDCMGLLWSMQSKNDPSASFIVKKEQISILFKVFRGKEEIASKKIIRLRKSPEIQKILVQEQGLVGALFLPTSKKPLPVIITLSGSNGGIKEDFSQLLASHGFAVFALGYFDMEGLPSTLQNIPLEYFETAFNWIKAQSYLDGAHIGIYGGSRGGELVLILGAWFPKSIQAIVAAVPSSAIYGGEGKLVEPDGNAWLYQGKPLAPFAPQPQVDYNSGIGKNITHPFKFSPIYLEGMKDKEAFNKAIIPVEKIRAPLLLISGGDDQMWPSAIYAFQVEERLKKYHSSIFWKHLYYSKAGHTITMPFIPMLNNVGYHPVHKIWVTVGGSKAENWHTCQDSWKKMIEFFEKSLKSE